MAARGLPLCAAGSLSWLSPAPLSTRLLFSASFKLSLRTNCSPGRPGLKVVRSYNALHDRLTIDSLVNSNYGYGQFVNLSIVPTDLMVSFKGLKLLSHIRFSGEGVGPPERVVPVQSWSHRGATGFSLWSCGGAQFSGGAPQCDGPLKGWSMSVSVRGGWFMGKKNWRSFEIFCVWSGSIIYFLVHWKDL